MFLAPEGRGHKAGGECSEPPEWKDVGIEPRRVKEQISPSPLRGSLLKGLVSLGSAALHPGLYSAALRAKTAISIEAKISLSSPIAKLTGQAIMPTLNE